jgi:hypothetical protein
MGNAADVDVVDPISSSHPFSPTVEEDSIMVPP